MLAHDSKEDPLPSNHVGGCRILREHPVVPGVECKAHLAMGVILEVDGVSVVIDDHAAERRSSVIRGDRLTLRVFLLTQLRPTGRDELKDSRYLLQNVVGSHVAGRPVLRIARKDTEVSARSLMARYPNVEGVDLKTTMRESIRIEDPNAYRTVLVLRLAVDDEAGGT